MLRGDAYVRRTSDADTSPIFTGPRSLPAARTPSTPAPAEKLLSVALDRGGDYADLFFEYRAAGGLVFDEGILKSASRGVSMGLGVRVHEGGRDRVCVRRAARLGRDEARGGDRGANRQRRRREGAGRCRAPASCPERYELDQVTLDVAGLEKRELLERAAAAAHAFDPRIVKVEASLSEEIREILVVTSDGTMARDTPAAPPLRRPRIAEQNGKRQEGSIGGGGRTTLGYFEGKSPEWHAREAARAGDRRCSTPQEAPAGTMEVVLAPGDSGILLHEAVGHGLEADFNRKGTSNYSGKIGDDVASDLCTVVDDATLLQSRGHHQRRRRGERAAHERPHREGEARRRTCTTGTERGALQASRRAATGGARASRARRCRA